MKKNSLQHFLRYLALSTILCALWGCSSSTSYIKNLPEAPPVERMTATHIPYPILLLHGLGQKAAVWDAYAVKYYEQEIGLIHGGVLRKINGKASIDAISQISKQSGFADFFTVAFSNPVDSIGAWERELEEFLPLVFERTKAEKVILIGYSMGGVTARYYLTKHLNDHRTERLISIGSPHQGSPFARAWQWKTALVEKSKDAGFLVKPLLDKALEVVASVENDVPIDSPAIRDLQRPEDGGEFMRRTGYAAHPLDVEYVSVVGKVELLKETQNLSKTAAMDLMRRALGAIGFGVESLFEPGDGVVSAKSQTISELPWFQADKKRQKISRTITLTSVHEEHLKQSTEIQRISLEDKPEFKGAEFYRNNESSAGRMVIDFVDYLPPAKCGVELIVTPDGGGTKQRFTVPQRDIMLVKKKNGSVVAQATTLLSQIQGVDWSRPAEIEIILKNTFGNETRTTKAWQPKA
ncbi:MAG: esterase/lipase family protein [Candidatus Kapaibacteriota bacterium]|jgi:triacylglycerol esterase/lipase EstA (alpha/beta hydrolase family)